MATGGSDPPISGGHEIFYEWRCNACEESDCIAEGIAYCKNCGECFCVTCLGVHKRFARDHTVLTEENKGEWGKSNISPFVAQEPGLECPEHKGQYVSMYCGHHDDVCCPLCAIFKHGEACKPTMSYIPSVAQGVESSADFRDFIATNEQLLLKIEQMEAERSDCLAVVSSSREECRMEIAAICQRLIYRIEELQQISITDADTKHDVEETTIRNDIDKCAELKLQLHDIKQQMQASNPINESALFIKMKSGQKCHQKCKQICESLSKRQTKTFEFQEDPGTLRASLPDAFGECIEEKRAVNSIAVTNKLEKDLLVTMNTGDDREGDQPEGTLHSFKYHKPCAGYDAYGSIAITYKFPSGIQGDNHPTPGKWYEGISRTAFLPDNEEGNIVHEMLKIAFNRGLMFTIGSSKTTGQAGVITWNGIHHKTNPNPGGKFGYPDAEYLTRVTDDLAAKGVTKEDIHKETLRDIQRRFRSHPRVK